MTKSNNATSVAGRVRVVDLPATPDQGRANWDVRAVFDDGARTGFVYTIGAPHELFVQNLPRSCARAYSDLLNELVKHTWNETDDDETVLIGGLYYRARAIKGERLEALRSTHLTAIAPTARVSELVCLNKFAYELKSVKRPRN